VGEDLWPREFLFGVATAGFQVEGGYNGVGQPQNNWAEWESAGRVPRAGDATGFFEDYKSQLDIARSMGLNSFRLSIEWARVEPVPGVIDEEVVARYRDILAAISERSMRPLVTLHHFTHPAWLGRDPWLDDMGWRRLADWYGTAAERFGDLCHTWITSNEINALALNSYTLGHFPPGGRGDLKATARAIDRLLAAHIVGYQAIKARQPESCVATNNYALSLYELDRMALDVLHSRKHGVDDVEIDGWVASRRDAHYARVPAARHPFKALEKALRRAATDRFDLRSYLPTSLEELRRSSTERLLDVAQIDYYAPSASEHLTAPGLRTSGGRWMHAGRPLWDDRSDPRTFLSYLIEAGQDGLPVWVVENGMATRRDRRGSWPRRDGLSRLRYLREHVGAILAARRLGIDVTGYWHWTLVDNYEWGSFEPRFGLHGLAGDGTVMATDSSGEDAAGEMRRIVEGLANGDLSVVVEPIKPR
jgi:beta-glucosidase/6-phospho-beta-glucosidase/beta-galactosidase